MSQRLDTFGGNVLSNQDFADTTVIPLSAPVSQNYSNLKQDLRTSIRRLFENPDVISDAMINNIVNLRYQSDNTRLVDEDNWEIMQDIVIMILNLGAEQTYNILVECSKQEEKLPWTLPAITPTVRDAERDYVLASTKKTGIKTDKPCRKCGKMEVSIMNRQMRSADEPETVMATCTGCGKTWRMQ